MPRRLIEAMNASEAAIVAVDLPSGVDASTGEVAGAAVNAQLAVTFHGEKVGQAVTPGALQCDSDTVVDIGLEVQETALRRVAGKEILRLVPARGRARQQVLAPAPSSSSAARGG